MVRNNPITLKDNGGQVSFEKNYSDTGGGMVYGLATFRGKYIKKIEPDFSIENLKNGLLVIDKYNNALSLAITSRNIQCLSCTRDKKELKRSGSTIKIPGNIAEIVKEKYKNPNFMWDDYFSPGEENPKFNIQEIYNQVRKKYGKDYFHTYALSMMAGGIVPRLLWKRGSKLGIEMAAREHNTVHFVVEGINMVDVVFKNKRGGQSVTSSELRYAFRNRERLKGRLFFYNDGELILPPWESAPELWANYDNKRVQSCSNRHNAQRRGTIFPDTLGKCFSKR
ncbi:hypothetical protein GOE30_24140 [Salmonella enterica]|uniref:Uncharacterized protein n=1 Tax=Salmonella enterica subsp. enterica serovar Bareilly TaxID=58096 RepID=A0A5U9SZ03_SALET|nr:hypothetical protein [Salmonella enterica]EBS4098491.1 hypothetical protein [Salmonella enterica subsp. enterica serovar Bareilly]EDE7122925.1 hypothetical protein [Salmonella enterica subsp. enterica serovar Hvittingfoss]EAM8390673.1 hypothetical protein [Salmonella enterica]EAX1391764.1 hypothetical protein [Salmonella enterica]EBQ2154117.1 hypothetical protein [Salmonella enterica]